MIATIYLVAKLGFLQLFVRSRASSFQNHLFFGNYTQLCIKLTVASSLCEKKNPRACKFSKGQSRTPSPSLRNISHFLLIFPLRSVSFSFFYVFILVTPSRIVTVGAQRPTGQKNLDICWVIADPCGRMDWTKFTSLCLSGQWRKQTVRFKLHL